MDEKNINFSKWRFSRWVVVFFEWDSLGSGGTTWCLFWESTCVARWCVSRLHFFAVYRAIKSYPNYTRGFFHTPKNKDPYVVTSSNIWSVRHRGFQFVARCSTWTHSPQNPKKLLSKYQEVRWACLVFFGNTWWPLFCGKYMTPHKY